MIKKVEIKNEDLKQLYNKVIKKGKNIASMKKLDLHIHTPGSKDYIWRYDKSKEEMEYIEFLNRFIESDLDAIAITDHNTIKGYKKILNIIQDKTELKEKLKNKYILPGVEITCFGRHFLVYFSEQMNIEQIEKFLVECGIDEDEGNENSSADRVTPLTLCDLAKKYNGIVILPHADSDKGFLKDYIKVQKELKDTFELKGGIVKKVLTCDNLLGVCIKDEKNRQRIKQLLSNYGKSIKIFKASDSHSSYSSEYYHGSGKAMGSEYFWANIGKVNFRTLKLFFSNPNTKIIEKIEEKDNPYIKGICLKGGFVKNKNKNEEWAIIPFSKELNCFIGARGTGKSTIIDIIKYTFNFFETDLYVTKEKKDEYIIISKSHEEEYEEYNEEQTIINRFDEIITFINRGSSLYALHIRPSGFTKPNATLYKYENNKFNKKNYINKLDKNKISSLEKFIIEIKPIIYQQKNILDIGNNKLKVTRTITNIIGKLVGEEYRDLLKKKLMLQSEIKDICNQMNSDRKTDKHANANSKELSSKYEQLFEICEKINTINIKTLVKMNKILDKKLQLNYKIVLPKSYIEELIYDIVKGNRDDRNIDYSQQIKLRREFKFLLSKIGQVHDLIYLLFTKQYKKIAEVTELTQEMAEQACDLSYRYILGDYVTMIPQVIIDFKLNVNYGSKNKNVFVDRENLSFGQRAVGILLIILYGTTISDFNQTIILDQPEDDLDNSYVYHTLVKQLADVKEKRQLIVATHSPNIAVAGNSENILVLKGNGESGWIECNGTIHDNAVSNEAVDILEGNETVFKERAELYGII